MENQAGYLSVPQRKVTRTVLNTRAPTTSDIGYNIPTFWLDEANNNLYVLVDVTDGVATWGTLV